MLPFKGVAQVHDLPGQRILGLSSDEERSRAEFFALVG
jgi:hypothetical protein